MEENELSVGGGFHGGEDWTEKTTVEESLKTLTGMAREAEGCRI